MCKHEMYKAIGGKTYLLLNMITDNDWISHRGLKPGLKPLTVNPPSTEIICPVIYEAAGMQRYATSDATSSGSPTR